MLPTQQGSFRLFRAGGIDVFIHWSWFLVAAYVVQTRMRNYSSPVWNVWEYLALFGIVLLHEFGHSLACRQVGGRADQIVLWPMGGVAYVAPPPRPGAHLWSIAAGPLVNVVLIPVLMFAESSARAAGWADSQPDAFALIRIVGVINFWLLIFNILPIYPLDGGQILRSLLWFPLGPIRSLYIATAIGLVGLAAGVWYLWQGGDLTLWTGVMAAFIGMNCLQGWKQARAASQAQQIQDFPSFRS